MNKSPTINIIAFFSVSLVVMLLLPMVLSEPRPTLLQAIAQAAAIAAGLGVMFAAGSRRDRPRLAELHRSTGCERKQAIEHWSRARSY